MFFVKQKILIISYICENFKNEFKTGKRIFKAFKEAKMEWIADEYLGGDDKCINLLKAIGMKQ